MPSIHSVVEGAGPALVLLHGIGSNSRSWRRQIPAFAPDFKVIAWDAPGFGDSEDLPTGPPTIRQYSESLNSLFAQHRLTSAIILGHSFGGLIAQDFYCAFPGKVQSLILADTSLGGGAEAPAIRDRKLQDRLNMIRSMTPGDMARSRAAKLLSNAAGPELILETEQIMSEVRPAGYENAARAMAGADTRGVLDGIGIPLLMIWGSDDQITPVWKDLPPTARLEIIPGAGHLCYVEAPVVFNSIVLRFLRFPS